MKRLVRFLGGVLLYAAGPAAAAAWAFGRTEEIFREKKIALPFECFGALAAAAFFCFALSAAVLLGGLWKPRKGHNHEAEKNRAAGVAGDRPVDAGVGR